MRSTVTSFADQRIQVISQRVMTTETLLKLIRRFELYADERGGESREDLIARMRSDINFRMISADVIDPRSGRATAATIAFAVSYTSPEPEQAVRVANELTSLYLNENLTQRARLAEDASVFLKAEGDRLSKAIAALETQLATFKEEHADTLPELSALNLELLDRTEQQLLQLESRQASLDQQRVFLEAQLAQLKPNSAVFSETRRTHTFRERSVEDAALAACERGGSVRARSSGYRAIQARDRRPRTCSSRCSDDRNDLQRSVDAARAASGGRKRAIRRRTSRPVAPGEANWNRSKRRLAATPARSAPVGFTPVTGDNPAFMQIQAQLSATLNDQRALTAQIAHLRGEAIELPTQDLRVSTDRKAVPRAVARL